MRSYHVEANFCLLHSRFWQLGLGGLALLAQRPLLAWAGPSLRQFLAALGLAMILASLFWLSSDLGLPGWPSLLPILGTCLIIVFANQHGAGRLLSSGPLVAVGPISYSAYLYHMPVLAFVRIASLEPPSPAALASTLPLILLLAWLSWRYIEQPFRDRERTSNRFVLWFCGATLTAAVACGVALHLTSGMRAFTPYVDREELFNLKLTEDFNKIPFRFEGREFPTVERSRNVLVLGNSFARDFINMGLESGAFAHVDVSYTAVETCQPLPPGLTDRIKLLESLQVAHIIVLGTKQFGYNNNAVLLLPEAERYKFRARPLDYAIRDNAAGRAEIPARYYVDLLAMLDNSSRTVPVFTPERKLISQDRRHMTRAGARFMGEKVFALPQFAWLRATP